MKKEELASWKNLALISGVLLCLLVVMCNKANPTGENAINAQDILPLKVGNFWVMRNVYYTSDTITATDTVIDTTKISLDTTIRNELCYKLSNGYIAVYLEKRNDGIYENSATKNCWVLEIKYPASINDTWIQGDDSAHKVTLVSIGDSVQIGNDSYNNCYHYRITDDSIPEYLEDCYMQPGLGQVFDQSINYVNGLYLKHRMELISCKLN